VVDVHCVRIEFDGYKRLSTTRCNTDTRLLAFVGPNEAGKSSLLEALVWLTAPGDQPLLPRDQTRGRDLSETHDAVSAIYELGESDKASIAHIAVAKPITGYLAGRRVNGQRAGNAQPVPERDPAPFLDLRVRLERALKKLATQISSATDALVAENVPEGESSSLPDPASWFAAVLESIEDTDMAEWTNAQDAVAEALARWLEEIAPTSRSGRSRDQALADAIRAVEKIANSEHPADVARSVLSKRVPRFIKFVEDDRTLVRVHPINDDDARGRLSPALQNLLRIAALDVEKLWRHIERGVPSAVESDIAEANLRLRSFFEEAWNQTRVTARFKVDSNRLELWLEELDNASTVTDIEERSDGLLMFVALAAFVAAQRLSVPPVLLIDEAETHLHFDAQADLVGVLLKQVNATQVFYSTHSPGCLPSDLGTGVRLVRRNKKNPTVSIIDSNFWTNQAPGFAPLLYAMGASAAAFSRCRLAVLAEGAADMVLLPTLIRLANDLDDLDYQIAPGLASAHAFRMDVEDVAAKVVYLTDGDSEGAKYRKQLKDVQVPDERVFQLPPDMASEDLVARAHFIKVANTLLPEGVEVREKDLPPTRPIAKAFDDWAKTNGQSVGHVAVAYGLISKPKDIVLAANAATALRTLHNEFMSAFSATVNSAS
jgi:predicted ATP-dependent endonuclease of OLD family